jgi:hypothetical protein
MQNAAKGHSLRVRRGIGDLQFTFLTIFLAACGGGNGGSTPPSVPTITSFSASPAGITSGQNTTLTWQVDGDTSLELDGVSVATTTSSVVEMPSVTTTYTLLATNSAGTSQQNATVTVTPASNIATVPNQHRSYDAADSRKFHELCTGSE